MPSYATLRIEPLAVHYRYTHTVPREKEPLRLEAPLRFSERDGAVSFISLND